MPRPFQFIAPVLLILALSVHTRAADSAPTTLPTTQPVPQQGASPIIGQVVRIDPASITIDHVTSRGVAAEGQAARTFTIDENTKIYINQVVNEREDDRGNKVRSTRQYRGGAADLPIGQTVAIRADGDTAVAIFMVSSLVVDRAGKPVAGAPLVGMNPTSRPTTAAIFGRNNQGKIIKVDPASITIHFDRPRPRAAAGTATTMPAGADFERTFTIDENTKVHKSVMRSIGENAQGGPAVAVGFKSATIADLQEGQTVSIRAKGNNVIDIVIVSSDR